MSATTARPRALIAAAVAAIALIAAPSGSAATANATWTGAASSPLWGNGGANTANWRGGTLPSPRIRTLRFPDLPGCDSGTQTTSCYTQQDDLGPLRVGQLRIGGGKEYQIYTGGSAGGSDAVTLEGDHPGAPREQNLGLFAAPSGSNLQLGNIAVPLLLGHDQTWQIRHYGILYLNSVSGAHALRLALYHGWLQANSFATGPLTLSGAGELQINQPSTGTAMLPKVTVNDSVGRATGLGISATSASSGSIDIAGTDNKFIVLTDRGPGETLLHVNGNLTLDPTTTIEFEIDGNSTTPGDESSQLTTSGHVAFHGADISLWQEQDNGNCDTLTRGNRYTLLQGGTLTGQIKVGGKLISPGHSATETFQTNVCKNATHTRVRVSYGAHALTATIAGAQ